MSSRSLQRTVSPRREQYSHLLDEMVGCGDMVMLEPLSEETIIDNLRKRYESGNIYVSDKFMYVPFLVRHPAASFPSVPSWNFHVGGQATPL